MTIEEYVEQIDTILDQAVSLPLSGGKVLVDSDVIRKILENIRLSLPKDIRQAQRIVADRTQILSDANRTAEGTIRAAEERAKAMIAQDEVVRQANMKANEMLAQAKMKSNEMRKAANEYVDDLMRRTEEAVAANLLELKKAHQSIRSTQRNTGSNTISSIDIQQ